MNEAIFGSSSMTRMRMEGNIRGEGDYGNAKFEIRNSKFETNSKFEFRTALRVNHELFRASCSPPLGRSPFTVTVKCFMKLFFFRISKKNPPGRSPIGAGGCAVC